MQCSKCSREAVIFQEYSGRHLCTDHLVADIGSRIKRDIRAGRWMRPGEHLGVALSGSRSSRALLSFLHSLTARRKDIRLSAIVIDEGVAGFRDPAGTAAFARSLGIPVHAASFQDEYGTTADSMARENGCGPACVRCRRLRGDLIETIAQREGITRILSARTIEDRAAEVLGKILEGKAEDLFPKEPGPCRIPWSDPLGSIPYREMELYAGAVCPGGTERPCPHRTTDYTDEIAAVLADYTKRHPATPYSIAGIGSALAGSCRPCGGEQDGGQHAA